MVLPVVVVLEMMACGGRKKHRKVVVVAAYARACSCYLGGHDGAYDMEGKHPHGGAIRELLLEERELPVIVERERTLADHRRERELPVLLPLLSVILFHCAFATTSVREDAYTTWSPSLLPCLLCC